MARIVNQNAIAAKTHADTRREATDNKETAVIKRKVAIVHDRTVINGHVLPVGCVVALSDEDIVNHRRHGVPLDDVDVEDDREVYNVSKPFVAKESDDDGEQG